MEELELKMRQDELKSKIHVIVGDIPAGFVLTYGIVAALAGAPGCVRLAARIISSSDWENCHRVVNSVGRTAPGWAEQKTLLVAEGVTFKESGNVDLKRHLWNI